jgi:hypothetical protein
MENVTLDNREGIKHLNWNITKVTTVEKIKITFLYLCLVPDNLCFTHCIQHFEPQTTCLLRMIKPQKTMPRKDRTTKDNVSE